MMRLGLAVASVVVVLDQATKHVILTAVMAPPRLIEVTGFFNLVLVWNRGVSFGMLDSDSAAAPYLLTGLAAAISLALALWLRRVDDRLLAAALGLVIGGAVGNAVDRLRFGAVLDFVDLHWAGFHWPAFNVADAAISIGVMILLYDGFFRGGRRHGQN